jgi:hypothetical protein
MSDRPPEEWQPAGNWLLRGEGIRDEEDSRAMQG